MSNSLPFFSIVIPTYNRSHLILKTIESVQKQSFRNFEIIVVDDHSTDNTVEVLTPLIESKAIKFILHEANFERAASRNTGIKHASGSFVTFLDSDDIIYQDNLKDAFEFIHQNPGYRIFHSLYELIDSQGRPVYQYRFASIENAPKAIAEGNFLSCICVFLARDICSAYTFDTSPELQGIEDWEYWMRIMATYPIGRINKINGGIVHHVGRSTTQYALESYLQKMDYVLKKFRNDPALYKVYRQHLLAFECSCYMLVASQANTAGLYDVAMKYLKMAIRRDPTLYFNLRFLRIAQISFMRIKSKL